MYERPSEEPASGSGPRPTTAQQDGMMRAMAANRRLMVAAAKARDAYVEACQETVEACQETFAGNPGIGESIAAAAAMNWGNLFDYPGFLPDNPLSEHWERAFGGAPQPDEWVAAGKRAWLEYIDSHEQAVLAAIDLRERMGEASNVEWIRSMTSTCADIERDVAKAYLTSARQFLR
jgi:hypothetical protein